MFSELVGETRDWTSGHLYLHETLHARKTRFEIAVDAPVDRGADRDLRQGAEEQ
jgi:hypothetical protein